MAIFFPLLGYVGNRTLSQILFSIKTSAIPHWGIMVARPYDIDGERGIWWSNDKLVRSLYNFQIKLRGYKGE
jgi:hypothetical protein